MYLQNGPIVILDTARMCSCRGTPSAGGGIGGAELKRAARAAASSGVIDIVVERVVKEQRRRNSRCSPLLGRTGLRSGGLDGHVGRCRKIDRMTMLICSATFPIRQEHSSQYTRATQLVSQKYFWWTSETWGGQNAALLRRKFDGKVRGNISTDKGTS